MSSEASASAGARRGSADMWAIVTQLQQGQKSEIELRKAQDQRIEQLEAMVKAQNMAITTLTMFNNRQMDVIDSQTRQIESLQKAVIKLTADEKRHETVLNDVVELLESVNERIDSGTRTVRRLQTQVRDVAESSNSSASSDSDAALSRSLAQILAATTPAHRRAQPASMQPTRSVRPIRLG